MSLAKTNGMKTAANAAAIPRRSAIVILLEQGRWLYRVFESVTTSRVLLGE